METESQKLDFSDRMTGSLFLMLSKYMLSKYINKFIHQWVLLRRKKDHHPSIR